MLCVLFQRGICACRQRPGERDDLLDLIDSFFFSESRYADVALLLIKSRTRKFSAFPTFSQSQHVSLGTSHQERMGTFMTAVYCYIFKPFAWQTSRGSHFETLITIGTVRCWRLWLGAFSLHFAFNSCCTCYGQILPLTQVVHALAKSLDTTHYYKKKKDREETMQNKTKTKQKTQNKMERYFK